MIATSMDSVLEQDFDDFEVIVSNDGSTDNTAGILSGYGDRILVVQGENRGCATARMRAIEVAQGEWIANHDADDIMLSGRLEKQIEFMQVHSGVAALSGNIIVQGDEQSNYLENCGVKFHEDPCVIFDKPFQRLLCRNFMTDAASMIRRDCFEKVGGYDLTLRRSADWDLWLRMARHWPLACMNMPCTWVGKHEGNRGVSQVEMVCNLRIIDKALRCGEPIDPAVLKMVRERLWVLARNILNVPRPMFYDRHWRRDLSRCTEHLQWYRRLLMALFPREIVCRIAQILDRIKPILLRQRNSLVRSGETPNSDYE